MASKNLAQKDMIFEGQFYPAGSELPEHQADMAKGKTTRLGKSGTFANQVGGQTPHQTDRPGMSGSGLPQTSDIVDPLGHVTKQGEEEGTDKAAKEAEKNAEKAAKEREKDQAKAEKGK